jgi:hypothetical protein
LVSQVPELSGSALPVLFCATVAALVVAYLSFEMKEPKRFWSLAGVWLALCPYILYF